MSDLTMTYTPVLFQAIAKEVARSYSEQYLVSFATGGMTVMFSTPSIEDAIAKATAQTKERGDVSVIAAEYMTVATHRSCCLSSDGEGDGLIDVDGVLVEISIRKIKDGVHRVLFSRVNALRLYADFAERLEILEKSVGNLKTTK